MKFIDNFKYFNRIKSLNSMIQCGLIFGLILGFYLILPFCNLRYDFSKNKHNSLHSETKAFLKILNKPLKVFLLSDQKEPKAEFMPYLKNLVHNINNVLKTNPDRFAFEEVNGLQNPSKLLQLKNQYSIDNDTGILFVLGNRSVLVPFDDFFKDNVFQGEICLLNAITQLNTESKTIYWLTRHGELSSQDVHPIKGGSALGKILEKLNFIIKPLDICCPIPEDAKELIILGPQIPFLEQECTELKNYLMQRNGRILLCLNPVYEHGLNNFLQSIKMACDASIVLDAGAELLSNTGDLLIRRYNPNEITQPLIDKNQGLVFGLTTPLTSQGNLPASVLSSETSWSKILTTSKEINYNPQIDVKGPHNLCFAYSTFDNKNYNLNLPQGKIVVVGCTDWLDNAHLNMLGNRLFFQSIQQYLVNENFIPSFKIEQEIAPAKLIIPQKTFLSLVLYFLILPFIFFILGMITIFVRRK